ncbi:M23 family metallopeptidase [uncultured Desulfovibrio sp.]|uniref:M23 family metallopeptidase n=1 Tax=uncultured Desulfovibrio sp. TaxID=167968 RepID=UPI0026361AF8|nr:M23 family metallopeptidase [uncultured Desulfovibrio sp.]
MRKRSFFSSVLGVFVVAVLLLGGYTFFKDLDGPSVEVTPNTGRLSPASVLKIRMQDTSGIRAVTVGVRKNNTLNVIFRKHFDEYLPEREVEVSMKEANLREGAFELEIRATDGSLAGFGQGNTRTLQLPMRLDTQPPRISVRTLPPNVRRGGAAVVRYTVDEDVSDSGVIVAGYFVPGHLQKDGSYVCFFPFPYTMTARDFKNSVEITARDLAGNVAKNRLTIMAFERNFRSDSIQVTDNFLQAVEGKLHHLAPDTTTPLDCYLHINNTVRAANAQRLREIGRDTAAGMLWSGAFTRLPRSAPRAGYGDHRFFSYQGKQVGESFHLGLDLASVRNAEVPAANSGRVVFCGDMGIYGNLIVIDHGLGLMSLYAHLNDILVKPGDVVQKGQIIAHTGSTGLAFGDHLHFGILVGGVEVTPIEWLDPKWIRDNITGRLDASMTQQ